MHHFRAIVIEKENPNIGLSDNAISTLCCRKHFFGASDNRVECPKTPPHLLCVCSCALFLFGVFSYFMFSCPRICWGCSFLIFGLLRMSGSCTLWLRLKFAGGTKDCHPSACFCTCRVRTSGCFRVYVKGGLGCWLETRLSADDLADSG